MDSKLYEVLMRLPKKNLVNLMWNALDVMQGYNGHSRTRCVILAAGGREDEDGKLYLPKFQVLKDNTNEEPL